MRNLSQPENVSSKIRKIAGGKSFVCKKCKQNKFCWDRKKAEKKLRKKTCLRPPPPAGNPPGGLILGGYMGNGSERRPKKFWKPSLESWWTTIISRSHCWVQKQGIGTCFEEGVFRPAGQACTLLGELARHLGSMSCCLSKNPHNKQKRERVLFFHTFDHRFCLNLT